MINKTEKRVAYTLIVFGLTILALLKLTGCGYTVFVGGPPGPMGPPGRDGLSIVSTSTPDLSGLCVNGGTVILMAQDTNHTGLWAPNDANQTSILVCNGLTGATGAQGPPGTSNNLGMVQFCPGPTVYPTAFPEFGICMNSQLYAVYWDSRNAWLALVEPGRYTTTSSSVRCNFTVSANCVVSP